MRFLLRVALPAALLGLTLGALLLTVGWSSLAKHFDAATQKRYASMTGEIAALHDPSILNRDGELDADSAQDALRWLQASAPDVDFYVLDLRGRIIAPDPVMNSLAVDSIPMAPLRRFLDRLQVGELEDVMLSDDPLEPGKPKIFSVALLPERGEASGYLYAVLENPMRAGTTSALRQELLTGLGLGSLGVAAILISCLLGLLFFHVYRPLGQLAKDLEKSLDDSDDRARGSQEPDERAEELRKLVQRDRQKKGFVDEPIRRLEEGLEQVFDRLENQQDEIASLGRVRREVLANFTHDLRTPIATVRGYLETLTLSEGALSPQQRQDYLEIALRHSERLSRLVDELLELSRLDRFEVAPRLERFRLGELVQDNIQRFRLRAQQSEISLDADFDPDMPPVFADVALMERALENLIDNALRHSKAGDRVSIRLRHGGRRLLVSVIDTGSGIASEDLPFVFDRFYRSSQQPAEADSRRGVGLGLAITRRIAELHGGQLLVESALGEGSTFTFSLEVAPLTYQLSTAELVKLRPTRWPPSFEKNRNDAPAVETEPVG